MASITTTTTMAPPTLPDVTDAHRQAAFVWLRMPGTYTAAMADPMWARLIEARAAHLRTAEWQQAHATRTTTLVRRINPTTGQWLTQRAPTGWAGGGTANLT